MIGISRADARRFHQLVVSDTAQARTTAPFAQGLQTRGLLELDLDDYIGALGQDSRQPTLISTGRSML